MGVMIVDGRTALQFKGSIVKFEKAIVALSKFKKQIDGLKIDTVPLPEKAGICVEIKFSGPMSEFEKVIVGLEKLKASVAIDTVPLPERLAVGTWPTPEKPAIGTWPTPERPAKPLSWIISVSSKVRRKSK